MKLNILVLSDNLEYIKTLPDNSVDSIITDSPYGLGKKQDLLKILQAWLDHGYLEIKGSGFMGKKWDAFVPQPILWKECLRVLKPGGYLLSFFGTRTYQLGTLAIEIAGFEIRDMICWHYGSGFPKSLDISKALDKAAGAERKVMGVSSVTGARKSKTMDDENGKDNRTFSNTEQVDNLITEPATDEAKQWAGWGNALKPATEPICVARKPLDGTTIENVLKWGTGGINIDGCRIATDEVITNHSRGSVSAISKGKYGDSKEQDTHQTTGQELGRFPANVILDDFMCLKLDQQTGVLKSGAMASVKKGDNNIFGKYGSIETFAKGDSGGASRFFYCAKANTAERAGMTHPTIKPIKLMDYLVRMFTPPGGIVLDPHAGSGPTCEAALNNGMRFIGVDNDPVSVEEAKGRMLRWARKYLGDLL